MYKFLMFLLLLSISAAAQNQDTIPKSVANRDSIRYTNLKLRMSKTKFSKAIYRLLFRDVYNQGQVKEVKEIETNPFTEYEGMIIKNIIVKQLNILGQSVYDTARTGNQLERFLSKNLHTNTREGIIRRSFLLFSEGDEIKAQVLKDNERLLRSNKLVVDARIVVIPRKDITWMADVMVIIQDAWSLNISGGFNTFNKFNVGVENINVQGTTHSQLTAVRWDGKDTLQKFQFRTIYTIPYIGKTFITGQANFIYERDLKEQSVRFFRPFLTNETKYAGALEAGHTRLRQYKRKINDTEVEIRFPTSFFYYDSWLGRAFKFPFESKIFTKNSRLVVALRHNKYVFHDRPEVGPNLNKIYWNRSATLLSLGFSNRNYKRDVLIYGFGRTEDVPVGNLLSVTGGQESTQFGERGYGGVQFAKGLYLPRNMGYSYLLLNFGSYFKSSKMQQGVYNGQLNYISNLIPFRYSFFRQFVTLKYTYGVNRDSLDYLNISREQGIRGISSDRLIGTKRLTLGMETVFFSDKSLLGFRIAYFVFADFGLVNSVKSLLHGPVYQGYGLGLRLRNENLTFNTIQLRVGYYPNIPGNTSVFRFGADGNIPLRLRDFDISAPSIVPLQ
ncbi:hypothetical protein DYBT9275_01349 [Dyadobacter sp. CECT 9275]|uniref:Outer membrane protein assembly factor BamA n=1 Tax=Dyadobacter helix TaxID=2822344 RepID=A0A916NB22_9BACT|nr:hypothetical protein [Dyadobacter sp. CECT 9275]CAG4994230.1 hypothetical protein DYBT9275_01349 [Dyadobacter sp. CECT 9275]